MGVERVSRRLFRSVWLGVWGWGSGKSEEVVQGREEGRGQGKDRSSVIIIKKVASAGQDGEPKRPSSSERETVSCIKAPYGKKNNT